MTAAPKQSEHSLLPPGDYVSPALVVVRPDDAFPELMVGDTAANQWPYLRRDIRHNWYVDRRNPTVGFLSRDEAAIIHNTALMFAGRPCLEIGCWRGWSTVHFALGSGGLDVIDPVLRDADFRRDVTDSLRRAGVLDRVVLHDGPSPGEVDRIAAETGRRWSMIFIDGDHEGEAPRLDAEAVQRHAADDALILFHDLTSPDVAAGLVALRALGWRTAIYQTMQIMGVAVRGAARPLMHVPDPSQVWTLPAHLASFPIIGESRGARLARVAALLAGTPAPAGSGRGLRALDALPGNEAAALDDLLGHAGAVAGDVLVHGSHAARAFDDLHRRHLLLIERQQDLERARQQDLDQARQAAHAADTLQQRQLERIAAAERNRDTLQGELEQARQAHAMAAADADALAKDFDLLHSKQIGLLERIGAAELDRDQLRGQVAQAQRAGDEAAGSLRDMTHERDVYSRLLDRALAKVASIERDKAAAQHEVAAMAERVAKQPPASPPPNVPAEFGYAAIRRFAHWMVRPRILFGLSRRALAGASGQARALIEEAMQGHGVPAPVIAATRDVLSRPRVLLGLSRQRALAGMDAAQGLVMLLILQHAPPAAAQSAQPSALVDSTQSRQLRQTIADLQQRLEADAARYHALEAAKLEDERALLEARLTIAKLRGPVVPPAA